MTRSAAGRTLRPPTVESLAVATFAVFGFGLGSRTIGDNSMFVHLRTGIDMVAGKGIPRSDPFSFTASGHEWVVQSWFPAWTYGWVERAGGLGWVAVEQGALVALVAWQIARLARTGATARTIAAAGLAIGAAAGYWSPRPLLFGLLAFALLVGVVERRASPWWLVPIVAVWVNSHGSFPLGLLWLGAVAVGTAIDQHSSATRDLARYVGTFALGLAVGAVNPLGPRLLTFPLAAGEKRAVFQHIREWQSPDFQRPIGMLTLVCLALALLVVARSRVAWRDAIPVVGFVALALLFARNIPVLAVVLAPVLGRALSSEARRAGGEVPTGNNVGYGIAAVFVAAVLVIGASAASGPGLDLSSYPVAATTWLDRHGYRADDKRIAQPDVAGCYFDLRFGRGARVFIDDRYDMFPLRVCTRHHRARTGGAEGDGRSRPLADRRGPVGAQAPLTSVLSESAAWRRAYRDGDWVVFVRR